MPDDSQRKPKSIQDEVWVAISAFEQILEAMPADRASLEALSHAYGEIGDSEREREYLVRLGNVLVDEGDREAAITLMPAIEPFVTDDLRAAQLVEKIRALQAQAGDTPDGTGAGRRAAVPDAVRRRGGFNMADELSFAWNLLQAGQLTEQEYSGVVQDLTEMSASEQTTTISVLHALEFRTFRNLDKVVGFVTRDCSTPLVNLASFSFPPEAVAMLPLEFVIRRGALVFEFIGQDALVVVMNPYNNALRHEVEAATGRKCHFFLAMASDFDQAIGRIRAASVERGAAGRAAEEK